MRSILLALLVFAAPVAFAATTPEARAQKDQGDRLRKAGDVDGAIKSYQAALKLDGSYAEAHEGLGELYFATKQTAKAVESFGYAVEIDPTYALAWYNLAFAARRSGDHERARSGYEKYVKLRPTDADGHYGLAESQRALGHRDAAIAQYQLFIDLAKTTPAQAPWVEKARAAQAELRGGAPAAPVAAAAPTPVQVSAPPTAPPTTPPIPAAATSAPLATPVPVPETATATATAIPITAPSAPASVSALQASPVVAPPVAPITALPPAPTTIPTPGPPPPVAPPPAAAPVPAPRSPAAPTRALIEKLGAGDRAYLSGEFRPALFAYQDAVYLDPTSAVARIKLARAYAALGHRDQADLQLKQAIELDPDNGEARKLMTELANPPPAAPRPAPVVTAIVPPPASAVPQPPSQRVYRLTDDAGGPAADATQVGAGMPVATTVAPAAPSVPGQQEASRLYRNALTMIGARDFKGAVIELDRALELSPQMGVAVAARASAFYGLGRYLEAARDYETALVQVPSLATPLYGLAETYRHLNDPRAGEYYARYARSDANDVRPELRETARKRAEQFGAQ